MRSKRKRAFVNKSCCLGSMSLVLQAALLEIIAWCSILIETRSSVKKDHTNSLRVLFGTFKTFKVVLVSMGCEKKCRGALFAESIDGRKESYDEYCLWSKWFIQRRGPIQIKN